MCLRQGNLVRGCIEQLCLSSISVVSLKPFWLMPWLPTSLNFRP